MKLDRHGVRFRFFVVFCLFAIGIMLFLLFLQVSLIKPYYRQDKTNTVKEVSDEIVSYLIDSSTSEDISKAFQVIVDNNVCAVLYNDQNARIYQADSLGSGCVFNAGASEVSESPVSFNDASEMIAYLKENDGEISLNVTNTLTHQDMVVYGRVIRGELSNYYLFLNSPLEPVDSIISFFSRQYLLYTVIVVIVASGVAILLSNGISRPIVNMQREAEKLSHADYSAHFDGGQYTETKELATTLNTATEKLSKIDELRKDLIANVSHDIKTPLTSIRAYAEMVRDVSGDNPPKRTEHLNVIIDEADYLNHLVTDMSELSKMQSGNVVPVMENFDLVEIIDEVVVEYDPLFHENRLHVSVEAPESLTVYADSTKIKQVVSNFVSNAIKHTPEGKRITIRAYVIDEDTTHLEVQDEGEGIEEKDLPYIWDRYQKSSRSFSRSISSTGLGLAIVKAILDAHHARYGVQSRPGQGSTFWFELDNPKTVAEDSPENADQD